jgi:hypothetical protein
VGVERLAHISIAAARPDLPGGLPALTTRRGR